MSSEKKQPARPAARPVLMAGASRQNLGDLIARQALVEKLRAPRGKAR